MATQVKVGARNDLDALKRARRNTKEGIDAVEGLHKELANMRLATGRPSYDRLEGMLGDLSRKFIHISGALDEMWVIREKAGQSEEQEDLIERVTELEADMAEVKDSLARVLQALKGVLT